MIHFFLKKTIKNIYEKYDMGPITIVAITTLPVKTYSNYLRQKTYF